MTPTADQILELESRYGRFVHMSAGDRIIWAQFLMSGGHILAPFEYDVRVGRGVEMPPDADERAVRSAYALTTKRIDVVGHANGRRQIIEVKVRAGLSAIGQLFGYSTLYRDSFDYFREIDLWLVTDVLQPDLIPVLRGAGIKTFQTTAPSSIQQETK